MNDARVLGERQVRAERQFLENAAQARRLRVGRRPAADRRALHSKLAGRSRNRAGEHIHQRRLSRAIVADEPDDFAARNLKVHAGQSAHRAVAPHGRRVPR